MKQKTVDQLADELHIALKKNEQTSVIIIAKGDRNRHAVTGSEESLTNLFANVIDHDSFIGYCIAEGQSILAYARFKAKKHAKEA